jgi:hypothetical protein
MLLQDSIRRNRFDALQTLLRLDFYVRAATLIATLFSVVYDFGSVLLSQGHAIVLLREIWSCPVLVIYVSLSRVEGLCLARLDLIFMLALDKDLL